MVQSNGTLRLVIDDTIERNKTICGLKSDVAILKSDVAILKSDVAILKSDVAALKKGQHRLEEGQEEIRNHLTSLGAAFDGMQTDLKLILDAVIPAKARAEQIDQVACATERQDVRLGALETAFKAHVDGHNTAGRDA